MSRYDPMFSETTQLLLKGKFICEVSHEKYFSYLGNETVQQRVNQYLIQIDRELAQTSDEKAYFCAYSDVQSDVIQRIIRAQFKEAANHLESFVKWIRLMMTINPVGIPISAGEILNKSTILASVEQTPSHFESLKQLTRSSYFKSNASDASGLIKTVLSKLVESEYLISVGRSGTQFQATAKWSWLYDVMAFIQAHEDLGDTPEESHQADILHG